jgi:HK97 gp10 family phage protein
MAAKVTIKDWSPDKITAEIEKKAMDGLERAGERIASMARGLVPVDTGALKGSIRVRRLSGDPYLNVRVYAGSREKGGAFYAHMVEYGTVKMSKKPFLRPALDSVKGNVISTIEGG